MYAVETDDVAAEQVAHLPQEALPAFGSLLDLLELHPWSGDAYNRQRPDGAVRNLFFGPGNKGMATYLILEDQRRVAIVNIAWCG